MADDDLVLEITNPAGESVLHDLAPELVIGRSENTDVRLDSARVSRRHAELKQVDPERFILRDLASRNGTRVNGQIITEQTISSHDRIQIGGFELRLRRRDQTGGGGPQTTLWMPEGPDTTRFTMLAQAPEPRLHATQLRAVSDLGAAMVEIAHPAERMHRLCEMLVEDEMGCRAAVMLRVNLQARVEPPVLLCPFALHRGLPRPPLVMRAAVEAALSSGQPVLAGGVVASGLTVEFDERERGVSALIACPIRIERDVADLLYVTLPHECGTVDWLALIALAAEQFRKSELQIEARKNLKDNAVLHHELQKAQKIQMSLVPHRPSAEGLEIAIGFEPCLWVGGDYVNVLPAPDGRVLLAIADVCGKGLPAAMVATGVHSIVHASIRSGVDLPELALRLNEYLLESLDLQSFVTMLAILIDPRSGAAQCVNAGHVPMLIIDRDGKSVEHHCGHNPPLGVIQMTVAPAPVQLERGQLLMLCTDGLTEMIGRDGKMLGSDGVGKFVGEIFAENPAVALEELRRKVSQALDDIRGAAAAADDRTFLLARRREH